MPPATQEVGPAPLLHLAQQDLDAQQAVVDILDGVVQLGAQHDKVLFHPPDAKLQLLTSAGNLHRLALLLDIAPLLERGVAETADDRDNRNQHPHPVSYTHLTLPT